MKHSFFTYLLLLLTASVFFSCKDDGDPAPQVLTPKMDGLYVYGTNTIAEDALDPNARMDRAVLNAAKSGGRENVEGVYGKYMYIGANSTISFALVENEVGTVYGAQGGGTATPGEELEHTDVVDNIINGTLVANGAPINVAEEGLYYVFVDTNQDHFRMMRVEPEIFGDAQPGQWSLGTPLPMVSASPTSTVFEGTNIPLKGATGYKYRFNVGYELYNDGDIATINYLGVESYGEAWDSGVNTLIYKDENIPHKEDGMYTVRLEYNAATKSWTETKTRTGNLVEDHSQTAIALFGNAFVLPGGAEANWDQGYEQHTPQRSGNTFTWSWDNVNLIQDREFIFLEVLPAEEGGPWGGFQADYAQATTVQGAAIDNGQIVNATSVGGEYNNYYVAEGGNYNITLEINEAGDRIVTIDPAN